MAEVSDVGSNRRDMLSLLVLYSGELPQNVTIIGNLSLV